MPFNLLFLPLLGGFIFVRNWERSRYFALRSDGHVLLFYAAAAGAVSLLIAAPITPLIAAKWPAIHTHWSEIIPFSHSGAAVLACLLGSTLWYPLNWFFDDDTEIDRVIEYRQNPLELLFRTAMGDGKLVALSVKSGKIYVGYIVSNINPGFQLDSVAIIPMMSGYRNKDTKTVVFTTRYVDAYDKIENEIRQRVIREASEDAALAQKDLEEWIDEEVNIQLNSFRHVVLVREIETAFIFQMDTYEKYFRVNEASPSDS